MRTRPASSSFVRWLERLPFVSPVVRWRKTKSASLTDDSTVRIASRPGSWMSRSTTSSSASSDIAGLEVEAVRGPERPDEQAMVEHAVDHEGRSGEEQPDVARVRAGPQRHGAGDQERAPDDHVVAPEAHADRVGEQHDDREADGDRV